MKTRTRPQKITNIKQNKINENENKQQGKAKQKQKLKRDKNKNRTGEKLIKMKPTKTRHIQTDKNINIAKTNSKTKTISNLR